MNWKIVPISLIFTLFISSVVFAQAEEIRRVERSTEDQNWFEQLINWMFTNWWLILLFLVFIGAMGIFVWFAFKYYREQDLRKDIHKRAFETTLMLARSQADPSRIRPNHLILAIVIVIPYVLIELVTLLSDTPLILTWFWALVMLPFFLFIGWFLNWLGIFARPDKIYVYDGKNPPKYVGNYAGDYKGEDGYHNIALWTKRKLLLWKMYRIVKSNINPIHTVYITKTQKGNPKKVVEKTEFKMAHDLIIQLKGAMLIKAVGLDKLPNGYFEYPVLQDAEGNIVDNRFLHADSMKSGILTQSLIDQSVDFSNALRESININPSARYIIRTGTESVERPVDEQERMRQHGY